MDPARSHRREGHMTGGLPVSRSQAGVTFRLALGVADAVAKIQVHQIGFSPLLRRAINVLFQALHQLFVAAAGKIAAFSVALVVHHAAPVYLVNGRFRPRAAGTAPVAVKTGNRSKTPLAAWHLASPPWMVLLLPYRVSPKVIGRIPDRLTQLSHHHPFGDWQPASRLAE
jgi:hypothetical protein